MGQSRISRTPYPPIGGAHAVTGQKEQANFWACEGFFPKSAKLARKFGVTFGQGYLEFLDIPAFDKQFTPIKNPFWCDLRKKDSCVFLQTLGTIF